MSRVARFRVWLKAPRKIPTNRVAMLSAAVGAMAQYIRDERVKKLERRIESLEKSRDDQVRLARLMAEAQFRKPGTRLPEPPQRM